ncbi:MAG: hypothetical protein HRU17_01560 [Polyangiaceae bacterium]|nr:hypothetical protein [Polyangiaceae bacterium]
MVAPPLLSALEAAGYDLGSTGFGEPARRAAELMKNADYQRVLATIAEDLGADRARDPHAGVGMRFAHRQFDVNWLSSPHSHFELVAVVNRLDREAFDSRYCGELRFLYRLAYDTREQAGGVRSRLPMTVNVVHWILKDSGCQTVVRKLAYPGELGDASRQSWLMGPDGPFGQNPLATQLKAVEVNFQSVRWPSTVRPNLAGHAEYTLRVFEAGSYAPVPLENTPNEAKLRGNPALARELAKWLSEPEQLRKIDQGDIQIPTEYLAHRAISVAPHGLARLGNRPFTSALGKRFAKLDVSAPIGKPYETFTSSRGVLRRLDGLSCQGCHQSRSIAGFHLLGIDPASQAVDAIRVPMSVHFHDDLDRRARYLRARLDGETPPRMRPPAERAHTEGAVGDPCALPDAVDNQKWTCGDGLRCEPYMDDFFGICIPATGPSFGDPCEFGIPSANRNVHRDYSRLDRSLPCADAGVCESNAVGFPGGMCSGACTDLPVGAVCGEIAELGPFNHCLASGAPFPECITEKTRPGALRACDPHHPCREDYICARLADGGGACLPPYFLFQMRVDGHAL